METELSFRLPTEASLVLPIVMIMQFLPRVEHIGFFEIMHGLMRALGKADVWQLVWRLCRRSKYYTLMNLHTEMSVRTFKHMCTLALSSWWLRFHYISLWLGLLSVNSSLTNNIIPIRNYLKQYCSSAMVIRRVGIALGFRSGCLRAGNNEWSSRTRVSSRIDK